MPHDPEAFREVLDKADKYDELVSAYVDLREQYDFRLQQLVMVHTALAVVLEEQGGVYVLDKGIYDNYDLHAAQINMYDPEDGTLILEVKVEEDE